MGYKNQAIKGFSWMSLLRVGTRGLTFVRLAILGRLLSPTQFGYFGIASLLLSLLEILTETGINVFLVQEKRDIREYLSSAWIVSIVRGIILALLIVIFAPFVAAFFNAPDATGIIYLMALVPFVRGFINPAIITYQKELLFHKEFQLRFILFIVDVMVSLLIGILTRSASSFVYGLLASAVIEVVLSYMLIPLWPRLQFEIKKVKHVIKRGWWVTLTGIFSYFADNGDNLVVGKLLGSASLGIYQLAYKFSTLPISEITNVVNQVVFPVYTKFSNDKFRLWQAFIKVTLLTSLAAFLFSSMIFFFAEPLILLLMGEQWVAAIPLIRILAIYGLLRTIFGSFSALFLSVNKQDYVAKMVLCRVIGLLIVIIPLINMFGMLGAGYAMIFSVIVEIPLMFYFTFNIFKRDILQLTSAQNIATEEMNKYNNNHQ